MKSCDSNRGLLIEGLSALSIEPHDEVIDGFILYLTELKRWSRSINLTGIKEDGDIITRHFLDSLLFLKVLPEGIRALIDIGTGAGFPGIPIKMVRRDIELTLIEPTGKKAAFLRHIVKMLGLDSVNIVNSRVEDYTGIGLYDAAVSRALYREIDDYRNAASRLVKSNGMLVTSKGSGYDAGVPVINMAIPLTEVYRSLIVMSNVM